MSKTIEYKLRLDDKQMNQELNKLEKEIKDVTNANKKLKKSGQDTSTAFTKNKTIVKDLKSQYNKLQREIINTSKANQRGEKSTNRFGVAIKSFAFKFNFLGNLMGNFATQGISMLVGGLKSSIKAFQIQEQAVHDNTTVFGKYSENLQRVASDIQKVTTVGDEQTLQLMTQAKNMGVANDEVITVTKGAIGLAEKFKMAGLGQETALKGVALAYEGDFNQLQRYIPALKSAGSQVEKMAILQKEMADGFDLATEAAKTQAGQMQQTSNTWGDFTEQVGGLFSSLGNAILPSVNRSLTTMNELIAEESIPSWKKWLGVIVPALGAMQSMAIETKVQGRELYQTIKTKKELLKYIKDENMTLEEGKLIIAGWAQAYKDYNVTAVKEVEQVTETIKKENKKQVKEEQKKIEGYAQAWQQQNDARKLMEDALREEKNVREQIFFDEDFNKLVERDKKKEEQIKKHNEEKLKLEQQYQEQLQAFKGQSFQQSIEMANLLSDNKQIGYDNDLAMLQSLKDNEVITEEQYNARIEKVNRKKFELQQKTQIGNILANTAMAIMKTWGAFAANPFFAGAQTAFLTGLAGIQIANVQKQQFYGEDGGMIQGARHAQGGVNVNMEGGEFLNSRKTVTRYLPLITELNTSANEGRDANIIDYDRLAGAMQSKRVYVVSKDMTDTQAIDTKILNKATF